jgi:hypothetical protein
MAPLIRFPFFGFSVEQPVFETTKRIAAADSYRTFNRIGRSSTVA